MHFFEAPWVRFPSHAKDPLKLKRLIETIEDRSEEDFRELLQISDSFCFFLRILPLRIEVYKFIRIFPVIVEEFDIHDILRIWVIR